MVICRTHRILVKSIKSSVHNHENKNGLKKIWTVYMWIYANFKYPCYSVLFDAALFTLELHENIFKLIYSFINWSGWIYNFLSYNGVQHGGGGGVKDILFLISAFLRTQYFSETSC